MLKTDSLYNAKNKVPCVIAHLKNLEPQTAYAFPSTIS